MPRIKLSSEESLLRKKLKTSSIMKEESVKPINFVSSGSWMLDLALTNKIGSAYPIGRVINIVGDYSSGKSLLANELVNSVWYTEHLKKNKKVKIYYDEPEAAYDYDLARKFNVPIESIYGLKEDLPNYKATKDDFRRSKTVEDFYTNISEIAEKDKGNDVVLYIVDSLDSLTDAREIKHIEKKGVGSQDYGGGKPRVLSQMFRTCIQSVNESNILLFIVSQVRENFGVMFGPKYTRAGGKALDHYASVIFWLKECGKITSKKGINQGIEVELLIDKNKVGSRYNKLNFNILHGYGVDNYGSAIEFLLDHGVILKSGAYVNWNGKKLYKNELIEQCANNDEFGKQLQDMLQEHWNDIVEDSKIVRKPKWGV